MDKRIILLLIVLILSMESVSALQQTVGALYLNTSVGNSSSVQYGLKNEENISVTVKFNMTGTATPYIEYPKELTLEPNQFIYIKINSTIPSVYNGSDTLNGTIYALKEGSKDGQVQLNIRLGKKIQLNVLRSVVKDIDTTPLKVSTNIDSFMIFGGFVFISLIIIVILIMKKKSKK